MLLPPAYTTSVFVVDFRSFVLHKTLAKYFLDTVISFSMVFRHRKLCTTHLVTVYAGSNLALSRRCEQLLSVYDKSDMSVSVKISIMDFQFKRCSIVLFSLAAGNFEIVQGQCGRSAAANAFVCSAHTIAHARRRNW